MTDRVTPVELDAVTLFGLDLDGVKLIEASAGTGKTHTIADLYLRHILAGRVPSQILVVTYTNAATEELRGRIRKRLYQALTLLEQATAAEDEFFEMLLQQWLELDTEARSIPLQRLQLALRSMDEAAISTIHSFCQRSMQDYALSGNQLFVSDMIANDDQLWEAATRDWWRQLTYQLDATSWQLVSDALGSPDQLIVSLQQLRNRPAARLLPQPHDDLDKLLPQGAEIATTLHALAPLWNQHRSELSEILSHSKVLSRAVKLPYHAQQMPVLIEAADRFFNASESGQVFDNFQYLGTECLHRHSKPSLKGQDPALEHDFFLAVSEVAASWEDFNRNLAPQLRINAYQASMHKVCELKREMTALAFQDQLSLLLEALDAEHGDTLAENLRRQFPVAMIDEFQDTDTIQYRIFERIYLGADNVSLVLIGDPKQAIYSFRGGDIFTYMQARRLPNLALYNLPTNWRSQPNLVTAVNTLFSHREEAFVYSESIDFIPVTAPVQHASRELLVRGQSSGALTLWQLPQKPDGSNYSRAPMRDLINHAILAEIAGLLANSAQQQASIDGRALQSGDIAILVRQASEGHALSQLLHQHGFRTVTIGRDSVFHSDEARGLYDLMTAVSQYRDTACVSRSLSSSLLAMDYCQIAGIVDDDHNWQRWVDRLARLHQLWERYGFSAMFQSLLQEFEISRLLAQRDSNERRITNLLHLAELLQQQSSVSSGISPLLAWFSSQFDEATNEEAELRLEDDESLIKIVTIHKSKGLQYPVVFVPFLWSCKQVADDAAVYFHDTELRPCFDLGSDAIDAHRRIAEKERLAEDIRLLYVALTRARSRVYLAWGKAGAPAKPGYSSQTALAYLLHSAQSAVDLDTAFINGFGDAMDFDADLQKLVARSASSIDLQSLPVPGAVADLRSLESAPAPIQLSEFTRENLDQWRINSFTALTRGVHQPATTGVKISQGDAFLDFPAGSHVGLLIHALLENLDFQQDIGVQCESLFEYLLPRYGISVDHRQTLVAWLQSIVATRLDDDSLSLAALTNTRRLNELEFDFALDRLNPESLNRFMQSLSPVPLQAVSSPQFCGLITGVIDLVFEHQGRYYLADYKSNFLGSSLEDYQPEKLQQAMFDRRYDLQSLLYALALHRFLAQRITAYDYQQHFGGSYYLFLRAMRPEHGARFGVHFERPGLDTIEGFEQLLAFTPAAATSA